MKIAILGTGNVATSLAKALLGTHEITFGSRNPAASVDLAGTATASHSDAVAWSDLVINATPGGASLATLREIGADILGDRILLDVANASDASFDLLYPNDSLARNIQEAFPAVRVVKSLNTMNTSVMANPSVIAPTTVFLSGNDTGAKATVSSLLEDIGWAKSAQLDLGDITTARGPEHYFLLFFPTLRALGTPVFNVAVTC